MTEPSDASDVPWLTLSEAAAQSGRHIGALRSMVRRKRIPARKGNAGAWLVQLPDQLAANPGAATDTARGSATGELQAELLAEVAELRAELGHAMGRLEGQERLIQRLESELALARLPWWRRLMG